MGKTGALYILVLFFLFSRWSVSRRYNGDCGLPLSPRRVIRCPLTATRPKVAPPVTCRRLFAVLISFNQ
uniref:Secreted protein n=1 Tax=Mesocestoides corti TaxID=53468 RepID=A0A5K3G0U0_MESCO